MVLQWSESWHPTVVGVVSILIWTGLFAWKKRRFMIRLVDRLIRQNSQK